MRAIQAPLTNAILAVGILKQKRSTPLGVCWLVDPRVISEGFLGFSQHPQGQIRGQQQSQGGRLAVPRGPTAKLQSSDKISWLPSYQGMSQMRKPTQKLELSRAIQAGQSQLKD